MAAHRNFQQQQLQLEACMQGPPQPKHFKKVNLAIPAFSQQRHILEKVPNLVFFYCCPSRAT